MARTHCASGWRGAPPVTLADARRVVQELADDLTGLDRDRALVALQTIDALQEHAREAQVTLADLREALFYHSRALDAMREGWHA